MDIRFDPFAEGVLANPYPWYRWLRSEGPCHHVVEHDVWVISRYQDVIDALRNTEVFSSRDGVGHQRRGTRDMISADPPEHTRLRRLVNRRFLPRAIADLEPRVREIINSLVEPMLESGQGDLVAELAEPLPIIVIAELLGIDPERRVDFKRWSDDVLDLTAGGLAPDALARAESGRHELGAHLREAVADRRERPRPGASDLITALVTANEADALTVQEILDLCVLLLVAGNETTTNAVGNGALAIMEQPDQWRPILEDPDLVPSFVEESLRYDAPIQGLFRTALEDVDIAGTTIPEGARVMVLFGSANRDDHHYPHADTFVGTRNPLDHVAFGSGIHLCLGAPLARLELTVLCRVFLERLRRIVPSGDVVRTHNALTRGVRKLPVVLEPR